MTINHGVMLALATLIFALGAIGFFLRRNALMKLMCIELMLNASNLALVGGNRLAVGNHEGQLMAFFVILIAAAEAAIGLALVIALFRAYQHLNTDALHELKH